MAVLLRLYVAGDAPNSVAARRTLGRILAAADLAEVELEVIDVFAEPRRALEDRVLATPTLLRVSPAPVCTVVGNLGDGERVLFLLGLGEDEPHE